MNTLLYNIQNIAKSRPGAKDEREFRLLIPSLKIREGDKLAITGPSGCGKSTTLDILGLSLAPDAGGDFFFRGLGKQDADIQAMWKKGDYNGLTSLRLHSLGYVLQTGELLPYLTVRENMELVARLSGKSPAETSDTAKQLAERLDMTAQLEAFPATLSVGQRQRVAIGRALVSRPPVILADEPTAALDPDNAARVMEIFLHALEDFGSALILVTHNVEWALGSGLTQVPFTMKKEDTLNLAILNYDPYRGEVA